METSERGIEVFLLAITIIITGPPHWVGGIFFLPPFH